ncbi:MAG: sugar ABC transporter ATP-binding protein [Candidatus Hydrothermota bacterium]|nr:MAG: sugar ABC transporter ATP-binding protein [Candidatus Hydrothermae bacterium]
MARVDLVNVTKIFERGNIGVKDVTFTVEDGEFAVILGPSGCGKTTTLRLIAGLEEVTNGEIYIGGKLVNNVPPKDRDIAMVFQNYALYPHMSVFDNMAFGLKMRKVPKPEIVKRVHEAAKILGIEHLLDRKPRELSGGQRQRVALGRAIVRNPKVFLFDEPLSNLDAKMRVRMRAELAKLHKKLQATSIYVTHDQVEAMTLGDKIILMKDGEVQQIADPLSLYHSPVNKFVAGFIGSPPMNFFEGEIAEEKGELLFVSQDFRLRIPSDKAAKLQERGAGVKVYLGLRPEYIYPANLLKADEQDVERVRAKVDFTETLGNEILLYCKTENHSFISRIPPYNPPKEGEELELVFDMKKCHIFDFETERNLTL